MQPQVDRCASSSSIDCKSQSGETMPIKACCNGTHSTAAYKTTELSVKGCRDIRKERRVEWTRESRRSIADIHVAMTDGHERVGSSAGQAVSLT